MSDEFDAALILAAEDCPADKLKQIHRFSVHEERMLAALMAHGPVLLRGGRGSGKSALLREAQARLAPATLSAPAIGLYISLRSLPILRAVGENYEQKLCELVVAQLASTYPDAIVGQSLSPNVKSVQNLLSAVSRFTQKRIVILWDDAAHLGREASLADFFDLFRTISSSTTSCKAAIYPGVTKFGNRFDLLNDASVVEVTRDESLPGFGDLFLDIVDARYGDRFPDSVFARNSKRSTFSFLARCVLGNMRAFVFACNKLLLRVEVGKTIGITELRDVVLDLAQNYYWPLLEEIKPKVGVYQPMIETAEQCGERLFGECGKRGGIRSAVVYRQIVERLAKPFEILEYAGFVSRREVSRAMKSGGRGARYSLNLCNLLEQIDGARLTADLFARWSDSEREEPVDFHVSSSLGSVVLPDALPDGDLAILSEPISKLAKSAAYPYGLTENLLWMLERGGFSTVGSVAEATDEQLDAVDGIGKGLIARIRTIVGQAIWM